MALSKNEKIALWVSAAIGVVVLAWIFFMRRNNANTATPSPYSPGSIGGAYPGTIPWKISGNGLPSVPNQGGDGCCGCSVSGGGIFGSMGDMINNFMSRSSSIFDDYQNRVYAAYPDSVTQYFNNPTGAVMSANSREVMGG